MEKEETIWAHSMKREVHTPSPSEEEDDDVDECGSSDLPSNHMLNPNMSLAGSIESSNYFQSPGQNLFSPQRK
jgi:hypothetical protein